MTIPEHSAGADALLTAMQQAPWEQAGPPPEHATVLKRGPGYLASDLPGQPVETVSEMIQYGFALGYVLPNNEAQALHHYKPNLPKTLQTIDHNCRWSWPALTDPAHILIEDCR